MTIDRRQPPPLGPERSFHLPPVVRATFDCGLAATYAHGRGGGLMAATLVLRWGSRWDPLGRAGRAQLVGQLAADRLVGGDRLGAQVEALGGRLEVSTVHDATWVQLAVLERHWERGLDLLVACVGAEPFSAVEIERVRGLRLDAVRQSRTAPAVLAGEELTARLFAGTPYAHPASGSLISLPEISFDDVTSAQTAAFAAANAALYLAGSAAPDSALAAARRAFAGWPTGIPLLPPAVPSGEAPPQVVIVDRPGAVQTAVRIGCRSIARAHPDRDALDVTSAVLGGKFVSRLNLNLREKHGYTYGARSALEARRDAGAWVVSADVEAGSTRAAIDETLGEIERLRREPVEASELRDTQSYLTGVFPYLLETPADLALRLAEIDLYGLPANHLETYRERVESVDAEACLDVARRHLAPERMTIVAVGSADALSQTLAGLGELSIAQPVGRIPAA